VSTRPESENNPGKKGITPAACLLSVLLAASGFHYFFSSNIHIEKSTFRFRQDALGWNFHQAYENRFDAVRQFLPAHGTIGYITDDLNRDDERQYALAVTRFLATQYSLAPLIVADDATAPGLVIGDFHSPCSGERLARMGLTPVRQFENGVTLLKRESK
jgi:hypothetical protein